MTVSIVVDANHHQRRRQKRRHEELKDIYRVMLKQEATTYNTVVRSTSSFSSRMSTITTTTNGMWRPAMISWMYSIVDKFDLRPQIVGTAMYYIDSSYHTTLVCATTTTSSSPSKLRRLLGITSLHLAMKIHEMKLFSIQDLLKIGNNNLGGSRNDPSRHHPEQFEFDDVITMERCLVKHLNYYLHPPTAECFVLAFGELLPTSELFQKDALGMVRVGMMTLSMELRSCISYSTLAYASLLLAMADVGVEDMMEHFEYNMETVAGMKPQTFELAKACEVLARHSTITTTSSVASAVAAAGQNDGTSSTTTITDRRPLTSPPGAPPPQPFRTAQSYVPSTSSPKSTAVDLTTKPPPPSYMQHNKVLSSSSLSRPSYGDKTTAATTTNVIVQKVPDGFEVELLCTSRVF